MTLADTRYHEGFEAGWEDGHQHGYDAGYQDALAATREELAALRLEVQRLLSPPHRPHDLHRDEVHEEDQEGQQEQADDFGTLHTETLSTPTWNDREWE